MLSFLFRCTDKFLSAWDKYVQYICCHLPTYSTTTYNVTCKEFKHITLLLGATTMLYVLHNTPPIVMAWSRLHCKEEKTGIQRTELTGKYRAHLIFKHRPTSKMCAISHYSLLLPIDRKLIPPAYQHFKLSTPPGGNLLSMNSINSHLNAHYMHLHCTNLYHETHEK